MNNNFNYPFHNLENTDLQHLFNNCDLFDMFSFNTLPFSKIDNCELNSVCNDDNFFGSQHCQYFSPEEIRENTNCINKLSFLSINIRSLNGNFNKLESLINELQFNPSVICVSETWLNSNRHFIYSLKGYDFVNKPGNNQAGGTSIFIKSDLHHNIITSLDMKIPNCEDLWLEITLPNNRKLIIGSIYRHPTYNFSIFQDKLLSNIETKNKI